MADTRAELYERRNSGFVYVGYCEHYFSCRNGDGAYQCMRTATHACLECHPDEKDTKRYFCARHKLCDTCDKTAVKLTEVP